MNKAIRFTALTALLLVVIMIGNLTRIMVVQKDTYANDPRNKRLVYEMKSTHRGQIDAGGVILAQSVKDEKTGFYNRTWPADPLEYGPILGYISDIYGLSGLELSQNDYLAGTSGELAGRRLMDQVLGRPKVGANVELTLNPAMQKAAWDGLTSRGYVGAVAAIRVSTGEILALVSAPAADPRPLADTNAAEGYWKTLLPDANKPLLNHATQTPLPPGSTFKIITTAAALARGYTPDSQVTTAARITLPNTSITLENYGGSVCGPGQTVTLTRAFAHSCNTAFADVGVKIGAEALAQQAKAFGVDEAPDIGIPVAAGTIGASLTDPAARAQSAIGQRDVTMTVLQAASMTATIANKGQRMRPYLIKEITGPDLKPLVQHRPKKLNRAVTPLVAKQITAMMHASEKYSGGVAAIASKTGTAEHGENSRQSKPHAWYVAFGPSDVAVAVVVENGGDRGQAATGASVAAPIGRAVIAVAEKQHEKQIQQSRVN